MHDTPLETLLDTDAYCARHLGSGAADERAMLELLGADSTAAFLREALPADIVAEDAARSLGEARNEPAALAELDALAARNATWRSFVGLGYAGTITPAVIQRNVLENPGWYTAYTPYQAEISQGRLEALLAFQQMVIDLTGLPVANASLLDEASAGAEAMRLARRSTKHSSSRYFVDAASHPQVIDVIRTHARWIGIEVVVGDAERDLDPAAVFGAHLQYPDSYGRIRDPAGSVRHLDDAAREADERRPASSGRDGAPRRLGARRRRARRRRVSPP